MNETADESIKQIMKPWKRVVGDQRVCEIQTDEFESVTIKELLEELALIKTLAIHLVSYILDDCACDSKGKPHVDVRLEVAEMGAGIEHALLCLCFGYRKVLED